MSMWEQGLRLLLAVVMSGIKWNFTKFLIDREGNVVKRFEPTEDMKLIEDSIKELL